jgi:hypothetical protein
MKNAGLTVAVTLVAAAIAAAQEPPKATVVAVAEKPAVHAGDTVRVALQVSLPEGLHVQSNKPRDPMLIPTTLTVTPSSGVTAVEIVYPDAKDFVQAGQREPLAVFEHQFVTGARLAIDKSVPVGDLIVAVRLRYQACNASTCFPPAREEAMWTLKVVPASTPTPVVKPELFNGLRFSR